ncbi:MULTISPECIES: sigma-70 family RNA polymerase sigma factor [Actinoplanes]|uniref:RNA polymerase sigma factor n=1 Tax=Actinoplanes TaxID=1865 RepID=UPI001FDEC3B6|nr:MULTISPECIES: sigma-70 family RNA polymerase sigma factor [Actinoplanes]
MTDRARRDALLVVRAQLGDRRALAELVSHWHDPIWRYIRRMLDRPGAADDVAQEAWAAALRALPRLRDPDRFAPWLMTIARRAVLDQLRERYRPEPGGEATVHHSDEADEALDRAIVADGLAGLPPVEREVLILYYLHDLSAEDCAQILGVPRGTVKSRLFRARRMLRAHLIERGLTHE